MDHGFQRSGRRQPRDARGRRRSRSDSESEERPGPSSDAYYEREDYLGEVADDEGEYDDQHGSSVRRRTAGISSRSTSACLSHVDQSTSQTVDEYFKMADKLKPSNRENLEKITLRTNIFPLLIDGHKMIYRYDVNASLVLESTEAGRERRIDLRRGLKDDAARDVRKTIMRNVLNVTFQRYGLLSPNDSKVYDDVSILFLSCNITEKLEQSGYTIPLDYLDDDTNLLVRRLSRDAREFSVIISPNNAFSLDSVSASEDERRNSQFLELLTSQDSIDRSRFKWYGFGRGYYNGYGYYFNDSKSTSSGGFETKEGVVKSVRKVEGLLRTGMTGVVVDEKKGIFMDPQNVLTSVCQYNNWNPNNINNNDCSIWSRGDIIQRTSMYLQGTRLELPDGRSFLCEGLSDRSLSRCQDTSFNRTVPSHGKYRDDELSFPNFPAAIEKYFDSTTKYNNATFHALEHLTISPNQRASLFKLQSAGFEAPRPEKPSDRWNKIYESMEKDNLNLKTPGNKLMESFGVQIANVGHDTEGFHIQPPEICYVEKKVLFQNHKLQWSHKGRFEIPTRIDVLFWTWEECDSKVSKAALDKIVKEAEKKGIVIKEKYAYKVCLEDELVNAQVFRMAYHQASLGKEVLLFYLDGQKSRDNHNILKLLETKHQVCTQHVTSRVAGSLHRATQTCELIIQKLNVKMGGLTYRVRPEEHIANLLNSSLVLGYDVAHPTGLTKNQQLARIAPIFPSVVGYAANVSKDSDLYSGSFVYQAPLREKVQPYVLKEMITSLLKQRLENKGELPEHLILVRDGVSQSQYQMVLEDEIPVILQSCAEFKPGFRPKLLAMIVTKRHNTRFVTQDITNARPPMVIDTDVVSSERTEFYLQTHEPIIGTVKIPLYTLLVSEIPGVNSESLQKLMLSLAFQHQICNAPVSLPEPVYQADEWAKRGNDLIRTYKKMMDIHHEKKIIGYWRIGGDSNDETAPIDWAKMTELLSYSGESKRLQGRRVNA